MIGSIGRILAQTIAESAFGNGYTAISGYIAFTGHAIGCRLTDFRQEHNRNTIFCFERALLAINRTGIGRSVGAYIVSGFIF